MTTVDHRCRGNLPICAYMWWPNFSSTNRQYSGMDCAAGRCCADDHVVVVVCGRGHRWQRRLVPLLTGAGGFGAPGEPILAPSQQVRPGDR